MDPSRLTQGQKIAAASGLVLLVSLWLSWYGIDLGQVGGAIGAGLDLSANAWQAFGLLDLLLFITAVAAIAFAALAANGRRVDLPVAPAQVVAGLAALATLLVVYRIINAPGPDGAIGVEFGAFIGLLSAAGVTFGAWRAMQEGTAPAAAAPPAATPAPPAADPPPPRPPSDPGV